MAYMNQERKSKIAPAVKSILKKYDIKASLSVVRHSTLALNIKSGAIDFIGNYNKLLKKRRLEQNLFQHDAEGTLFVNNHWYHEQFDGKALEFFKELIPAMNDGNHDRSDIQTDYFDVGWYVDINVGRWDKPYTYEQR